MATNVYGDINPRVGVVATKMLLERGQHKMVLERFGQRDPQPMNSGKTRKYRRYLSLPKATSPLVEGVSPAGQVMNYEDVTINLSQWGDKVTLSDVIEDTHEDPVLKEYMKIIGEQAADTIEWQRFVVLRAGTSVFYSGSATTRATVDTKVQLKDFRRAFRFLKRYKAQEISEVIAATAKVATEPVGAAYFAVGHTDLQADIQDISGFVPVEKYSSSTKVFPGEIGKLENIRIILSAFYEAWTSSGTTATTNNVLSDGEDPDSGDSADVYPIIVFGRDSYATVPLQGREAITPMVLNPNQPRGGDELGQKGSVGWKAYQGCGILNQTWMCRIECAASALV